VLVEWRVERARHRRSRELVRIAHVDHQQRRFAFHARPKHLSLDGRHRRSPG
jgi:hypothetical protein